MQLVVTLRGMQKNFQNLANKTQHESLFTASAKMSATNFPT